MLEEGEKVPSLAESLEMTTVPVFIEVKVAGASEAVAARLAALPEDSPAKASTVISFHAEALEAIRRGDPGTPVSYLVGQVTEEEIRTALELGASGIGPGIDGLSLGAARVVREAGLRLNPWTVNSAARSTWPSPAASTRSPPTTRPGCGASSTCARDLRSGSWA
ncbi:glycerophosphodiester phosphodiesterase [Brachybacterium sp. GPGPB12]|uniref:glycerophosphodiester phosphodiesterase n=1 Tax=Brachybacterium sp. GPGPB12 TaxID=3023517 RepID=UPI0031343F9F